VNDWDAVIGEAALGLDLARVDSVRDPAGLALARRSRPAAVLTYPSQQEFKPNGLAVAPPPPLPAALDADAIFRAEALEFRARGHDTPGSVVRLGSSWITWAYRVTLVLLAVAIASLWFIRTDESTAGPVAVDGRTGMVAALIPASAGADLAGSPGITVVLPGGRSVLVTGLHAVLADNAAIRNAGFTPLTQPAILVTGQFGQSTASVPDAPLRAHATIVLRSETLADVLARQFTAMLGQGTTP
jgi:hypothetical protein